MYEWICASNKIIKYDCSPFYCSHHIKFSPGKVRDCSGIQLFVISSLIIGLWVLSLDWVLAILRDLTSECAGTVHRLDCARILPDTAQSLSNGCLFSRRVHYKHVWIARARRFRLRASSLQWNLAVGWVGHVAHLSKVVEDLLESCLRYLILVDIVWLLEILHHTE